MIALSKTGVLFYQPRLQAATVFGGGLVEAAAESGVHVAQVTSDGPVAAQGRTAVVVAVVSNEALQAAARGETVTANKVC